VVKRPERVDDYSPVSSVENRNERFYILFLLYAFLAWTKTTSLLTSLIAEAGL